MGEASNRTVGRRSPSTARRHLATLLVLAALVAAAGAACAVLPVLFAEDGDEEPTALLEIEASDIEAISWSGDGGSGSIRRADSEGSWAVPDDGAAELDGDRCEALATALASAGVERTIDADEITEEMGLDDPDATVDITTTDGAQIHLTLSDPTGEGSTCYARLGDSDADGAYLLTVGTLAQTFDISLNDLYAEESGPASTGVVSLTVERPSGTLTLSHYEGGNEELSYTDEYTWFAADGDGTPVAVDESDASELVDIVNDVAWETCVDATYDGTTDYGLDTPALTATLSYVTTTFENAGDTDGDGADDYESVDTPGSFSLVVGDQAPDGDYYAQPQGSSKVYILSADDVEALLDAGVDDMLPDDVCLIDWDTVESVEISVGGQTTTIELVRDAGASDETSDGSRASSYLVNGSEADADAVEDALDALDGLASEGEATGEPAEGAPEVTVVFHRDAQAFQTVTLTLTRYDTSFYLAGLDGAERLLVNRNDVAELEELVSAL